MSNHPHGNAESAADMTTTENTPYEPPASARSSAGPHTREEHAAILEAHAGDSGLMTHRYRRCGFSGAGNCCCGRAYESALHPHPFTLSRWGKERGRWLCVCSKGPDHPAHQEATADAR